MQTGMPFFGCVGPAVPAPRFGSLTRETRNMIDRAREGDVVEFRHAARARLLEDMEVLLDEYGHLGTLAPEDDETAATYRDLIAAEVIKNITGRVKDRDTYDAVLDTFDRWPGALTPDHEAKVGIAMIEKASDLFG